jgi:acetyl esterase/lipase
MNRNYLDRMFWLGAALAGCLLASLDDKRATAADFPKFENAKAADLEPSAAVVHQPDLIYRTVGDRSLMLDVIFPKVGKGPFPAVILLHGSGPANKGRKGMVPLAQELARQGYVGIGVSYRCKPEDGFPAPIQDVQCAIRWLRANAGQCKIDKDRIGVLGFSGGGTLACLLGMKNKELENQDGLRKGSDRVRAIVSFYGATDLASLHEGCAKKSKSESSSTVEKWQSSYIMQTLEKWLGGPPSKVPELYDSASPMNHSEKDSCPMLLIHGADDSIVPVEQSRLFAKKLQESGRPISLLIVEGAGHDFEEKNKSDGRLAFAAVLAFLDDHLLGLGRTQSSGNRPDLPKVSSQLSKEMK